MALQKAPELLFVEAMTGKNVDELSHDELSDWSED
jgi:hypothetical protein